jgi:O-antigen ligase
MKAHWPAAGARRVAARRVAARPINAVDVLVGVFVASAGVGVWAAYDASLAWPKFWLIVAAAVLYYALARLADARSILAALGVMGAGGAAFALYFLAANDWTTDVWLAHAAKAPVLVSLGASLSAWLPALPKQRFEPDVVSGVQAMLLPVYAVLIVSALSALRLEKRAPRSPEADQRAGRARWRVGVWLLLAALALVTWLVGTSRGAWLAVLVVAGLWAAWRGLGLAAAQLGWPQEKIWSRRNGLLAAAGMVGVAALAALVGITLSGRAPEVGGLAERVSLWREAALLARDYVFTGAGLGTFPLQYSVYTLLIHVIYVRQSYNLVLDLLIGQGLAGLVSYVALSAVCIVLGLRRLRQADTLTAGLVEAGLAMLGVTWINGLLSDAIYGSSAVVLLFAPLGLITAGRNTSPWASDPSSAARGQHLGQAKGQQWALAGATLAVLIALGGVWQRPLRGWWYANLGALEQSRAELRLYDPNHFDSPTLDQVRQRANLGRAIEWLQLAIQIEPANPTARQRLAAIALSRGQYAAGLDHMQAVWDAGQRDTATRKLLSDALVASGRAPEGAQLVQGLVWADGRLAGQAWYRYWVNQDYARSASAWQAVVALKPGDVDAALAQAEAARQARAAARGRSDE